MGYQDIYEYHDCDLGWLDKHDLLSDPTGGQLSSQLIEQRKINYNQGGVVI